MNRPATIDRLIRVPIGRVSALLLVLALAGCAGVPTPLQGDDPQLPVPSDVDDGQLGQRFLWGGTLVVSRPGPAGTCLELLARPLDRQSRPQPGDASSGRFRACRASLLDPQVFAPGRDVTVIGRLARFEDDAIGDYPYRFPVLDADVVHLWPERVQRRELDPGPVWWHYGWPYRPYGGPFFIGRYRYLPYPMPVRPLSAPAAPRQPDAPER